MKHNTTDWNNKTKNATTSSSDLILISKAEIDIKNWELFLDVNELEKLIEHRKVFIKFITKTIHKLQAELWMCQHQWKENDVYVTINGYKVLQNAIENTTKSYMEYIKNQE